MNGMAYGRDTEVVQRLRPEPMTLEEQAAQDKINEVDFEIFMHKMNMIAQEGKGNHDEAGRLFRNALGGMWLLEYIPPRATWP